MAKPIGPLCNLDCSYCYYLEKERLYPANERFRMDDGVLESFVRQYIESQDTDEVTFAWQGGEPTIMGLPFFERVVAFQRRHAGRKRISNALQTNGTLLDDAWGRFFREHGFLVGLSIDGPRELHDVHRVDKRGRPSWEHVMAGLELLKKHRVEFNTLTVVNRVNSRHPLEVYRFLRQHGSGFIQFIPLVERRAPGGGPLTFAPPPGTGGAEPDLVSEHSVEPETWGRFLCAIYDEWIRRDVGRVFVQQFDNALGQWMGRGSSLCVFAETCGRGLALEHNGDLYSCDHYVYPEYRLGNVARSPLLELVNSPRQVEFGTSKRDALPRMCRECTFKFACWGECPKHRFLTTPDGEPGLNYLCAGYLRFFRHIDPTMREMADRVSRGRPAAEIMSLLAARERPTAGRTAGRNDPCPCGSGKKFKRCCGAG